MDTRHLLNECIEEPPRLFNTWFNVTEAVFLRRFLTTHQNRSGNADFQVSLAEQTVHPLQTARQFFTFTATITLVGLEITGFQFQMPFTGV